MSKIRVKDLAVRMGIDNQDLVFKLRSIGVRIENENSEIDTDILQSVLSGKRPRQTREVIVRDEASAGKPVASTATPATPPPARLPSDRHVPRPRPRTVIHSTESKIPTLPTLTPAHEPEPEAPVEEVAAATAPTEGVAASPPPVEVETPAPAEPEAPAAASAEKAPSVEPPRRTPQASPPPRPAGRPLAPQGPPAVRPPMGPGRPDRGGPPARHDGGRPGGPPMRGPGGPPMRGPGGPGGPPNRGPGGPGGQGGPGGPRPGFPGRPAPRPAPLRSAGPVRALPPIAPPPGEAAKGKKKPERHVRPGGQAEAEREVRARLAKPRKPMPAPGAVLDDDDDGAFRPGKRRAKRQVGGNTSAEVNPTAAPRAEGAVTLVEGMTVRDFAEKLGITAKDLMRMLVKRGVLATINHVLDTELAAELALELGVETREVTFEQEIQHQTRISKPSVTEGAVPRAPVVTIMGHVDHGKTTLLDVIRSSKITESEHGGITQHIGAYEVKVGERKVVFVDTPGHEAFTMLRARGAQVTDIVVLVVAADDGVMPQTVEAIDHARAAGVPIIVAINKIDKANANPDRVKKELSERGLLPEDWGGDTVMHPISALKKQGIDELMELLLLTADLLELKANLDLPAQGAIIEARREVGRGTVATVLVQNGTLKVGDIFVSGATWGRVRAMTNDFGDRIKEAGPSTPVELTGFDDIPTAGDALQVVEEEIKARTIAEFRQTESRAKELAGTQGKVSLERLFAQIRTGEVKELPVIVKADVQGSIEVLRDTVEKQSTEKVKVRVIHAAIGAVTTNDVLLASAAGAIIFGFNVRPERNASELAEKEGVEVRLHTVIYELADELKKAMVGLLEPTFKEVVKGRAEVRQLFKVPKAGMVAGCHVIEGTIVRTANVRLLRDNVVIHDGKLASLRRFKDDAAEVRTGFDCGLALERYNDLKPGDIVEAYVREEVAPTL
jgi:translation initiation factor IF-2